MSSLCLFFFVMMNLKLIREEDFFSMKRSKFIKQAGALGAALAMTATPVMAATDLPSNQFRAPMAFVL